MKSMQEINRIPAGGKRLQALMRYGDDCRQRGWDSDAAKAYGEVMCNISWSNPGSDRALLEDAYKNLCALCLSHDECAWEIASQVAGDYAAYLREHSPAETDK